MVILEILLELRPLELVTYGSVIFLFFITIWNLAAMDKMHIAYYDSNENSKTSHI